MINVPFGDEQVEIAEQWRDTVQDIANLQQLNFISDFLLERAAVKNAEVMSNLDRGLCRKAQAGLQYAKALQDTAHFLVNLKESIKEAP